MNKNKLDKVAKGLLNLNSIEHKKPKTPNKEELNKKFVMRLDKNGNLNMKEV